MNSYLITEKQNENSKREGELIQAKNLASAKRKASNMQMFQDTVLTIEAGGFLVATKKNGSWINA